MSARAESRSEYETGAERGRRAYRLDVRAKILILRERVGLTVREYAERRSTVRISYSNNRQHRQLDGRSFNSTRYFIKNERRTYVPARPARPRIGDDP